MTETVAPLPRTAYRVSEVAQSLGVSKDVVYKWIYSGDLPATRVGASVLIPVDLFDAWLAARKADAQA